MADATESPKAPQNIILPKLTVKDCKTNAKAVLAQPEGTNERVMLVRFYGIASSTKNKTVNDAAGNPQVYEQLRGDFRGVNLQTGERFQSGILYLPEGIHELIAEPLNTAKANNEAAEVTFAMDVFSEKRSNPAGYGYGALVLGEPAPTDAMGALEGVVSKAVTAGQATDTAKLTPPAPKPATGPAK